MNTDYNNASNNKLDAITNFDYNYARFLFDADLQIKTRYQPVIVSHNKGDSFILKYSIPGYHSPRQYFKFRYIPDEFPNLYVEFIFRFFNINDSTLSRCIKKFTPKPNLKTLKKVLKIDSEEDLSIARYNYAWAVDFGRRNHSLTKFDVFYDAFVILNPDKPKSRGPILNFYDKLISE